MAIVNLYDVDVSIGGPQPLLADVELGVEAGERVCVVGRNGSGKSTLLKLIAGDIEPDDGTLRRQSGLRIAALAQEVAAGTRGRVFDVVAHAVGHVGDLVAEFHRLSQSGEAADMDALGAVQARIDAEGGWDIDRRVGEVITRLVLDPEAEFTTLSGGMQRRVLLAQALARSPDLLLLDEPTNHLDIDNIAWLESFLKSDFGGTVVFVTHDRRFLHSLATRIVEIDRGTLVSYPGDYEAYLRRREERLDAEAQAQARFDKRLAQEEAWIRQGIKARRKRNMGRVRELAEMRRQRARRREHTGRVRMEAAEARDSGKRLIEAQEVSFAWDGAPVVDGLSTTILRGDRVGIIGPNGSGKTTLIQLLLGRLRPRSGTVRTGTNMEVAYFDQQRATLDPAASALDSVAGGREYIEINGRQRHAMSYLQDFLFTPARARAPITRLSGGERNRLLLARLFSRPSNVLVMDEPTNDLDIETLELLEELVGDYRGTVLLVSHDREFLDNAVTSVLVLEGGGRVVEHVGGYSDWLERHGPPGGAATGQSKTRAEKPAKPARAAKAGGLSPPEAQELEALPERIEALEARVGELAAQAGDPGLYRDSAAAAKSVHDDLAAAQGELDRAYARWQELEERRG